MEGSGRRGRDGEGWKDQGGGDGMGKGGRIREEWTVWGRVEGDCEDGVGWRNEVGEGLLD